MNNPGDGGDPNSLKQSLEKKGSGFTFQIPEESDPTHEFIITKF